MNGPAVAQDPDGPGPIAGFTLRQFWKMCDADMSDPVVLGRADISKPFVYDRRFGFYYVPMGRHQQAISLLLAFHLGMNSGLDAARELNVAYSSGTADHWLENIPGTAFRSSQGKRVLAGRRGNLSAYELRLLGPVEFLLDSRT